MPEEELPPRAEPVRASTAPTVPGRESVPAHEPVPDALPPLEPFYRPSPAERPLPRGCHPLVFGLVMATLQFAATCYFMPSCFHAPG